MSNELGITDHKQPTAAAAAEIFQSEAVHILYTMRHGVRLNFHLQKQRLAG